jgi:GTP-binding protein HflX
VSLVGYTNAGKSTLFNALTAAGVYAQDQLFATLDPTLRRLQLADGTVLILADTVGFVSRLPHELVAAFKSTLQETVEADLLLHVIDAHSPQRSQQITEVEDVLGQIDADEVPMLEVYNKTDLMPDVAPHLDADDEGTVQRVWLSAATGDGIDLLLEALRRQFAADRVRGHLHLRPEDGRLRALLCEQGAIRGENHANDGGWELDVELDRREYERMRKREPVLAQRWDNSATETP